MITPTCLPLAKIRLWMEASKHFDVKIKTRGRTITASILPNSMLNPFLKKMKRNKMRDAEDKRPKARKIEYTKE